MSSCTGKEQLWFILVGMPPKATSVTLGLRLAEPGACGEHTGAETSSHLVFGSLQASPVYVNAQGGLGLSDPTVDCFLLGSVHLGVGVWSRS